MLDVNKAEGVAMNLGLPPAKREHRFADWRMWKLDLAWPDLRLAIEIEGGIWVKGRHIRPSGYEADCEKYSTAAALGWRVLRATPRQIKNGMLDEWLRMTLRR